ncbi:MAG: class E sortase [Actinomycetota bacterium]
MGEILVTLGVLVFLFMGYMYWGTAMRASGAQRSFAGELDREWGHHVAGPATADPGSLRLALGRPFAFIRIPAFGARWKFAIVQGTDLAQLALGPGHVPGTQLPGQLGNFAVAGHRVTAGNPFWNLPRLHAGDRVFVQTRAATYEYQVFGRPELVSPLAESVLAEVPGQPGQPPTQRLITLITCDPAWTGTHRLVVTGVLVKTRRQG